MTVGIGPLVGFIFPNLFEGYQGYLDLKAYKDIETENRPQGWSTWATFSMGPEPPGPAAKPMIRKWSVLPAPDQGESNCRTRHPPFGGSDELYDALQSACPDRSKPTRAARWTF